jgi:hypothetical protein
MTIPDSIADDLLAGRLLVRQSSSPQSPVPSPQSPVQSPTLS